MLRTNPGDRKGADPAPESAPIPSRWPEMKEAGQRDTSIQLRQERRITLPRLNYTLSERPLKIPRLGGEEETDLFTAGPTARWAYRYGGSDYICHDMMQARYRATGRISRAWADGTQREAVRAVAEEMVDLTAQGHRGLVIAVEFSFRMYMAHAGMRRNREDTVRLWRGALEKAIEPALGYPVPDDLCRILNRIARRDGTRRW